MKMKRITAVLLSVIMLIGIFCVNVSAAESKSMRGAWVSTVVNLDFPSKSNLSVDEQKKELNTMFDNLKAMGINTVMFQVRPCGDALYKSSINPWSQYLTGTQGKDPGYDPLAYAIEQAHNRGMELHAWLNPYRVTMKGNTDVNSLAENNPARLHPDWLITYNDSLTFNPSMEEVKSLICDTVKEIVTNYDVDAIHFDDYFYPSNYPLNQGENGDGEQAQARRNNVDDMVKRVHDVIKTNAPDVEFGISPMGIWKNAEIDGYQIKGAQSYYTVYGDTVNWIKNGWIDYVTPQIYWTDSHATASYGKLVKWWNNTVQGTGVKLYIGEAIYKDNIAAEMGKHFDIDSQYSNVSGNMFFRAKFLLNNTGSIADTLKKYYGLTSVSDNTSNNNNTDQNTNNNPADNANQNTNNNVNNNINQNTTPSTDNTNNNTSDSKPTETLPDVNNNKNDKKQEEVVKPNKTIVTKTAVPTNSEVKVDGVDAEFEAYNIDGYNYFKLRDIAYAINGSEKQFNTVWDSEKDMITLDMGKAYVPAGGEMTSGSGKNKTAVTSTAGVLVNGTLIEADAYNIDGMNYYKLRDIAKAVNFGVSWSDELNSIGIFTMVGYEE